MVLISLICQKYIHLPPSAPNYLARLGRYLHALKGQAHLTHAERVEKAGATATELWSPSWGGLVVSGINRG